MDLFHRSQETPQRTLTWIKPFDTRMDEITRLSDKAESCPKEMKKVFLSAWQELASQIKMHQRLAATIVETALPLKVYYNLVLNTDMGGGTVDFLIISDEYIIVVMVKKTEHFEWDRYDTRFCQAPSGVDIRSVENAAGLVSEWLLDARALPRKDLIRVVPLLIDDEAPEECGKKFPTGRSVLFPDIRPTMTVSAEHFGEWLQTNCAVYDSRGLTDKKQNRIVEALDKMPR